jgi:hypothetical protein
MASMTESEIGCLVVSLEQKNIAIKRLELSLASALDLITIRDRKIELQDQEIAILKKLLALQKPSSEECPIEPSWFTEPPVDRADLETDEYPHYDELMEKKDA